MITEKRNKRLWGRHLLCLNVAVCCVMLAVSVAGAASIDAIQSQKVLLENGMTVVTAEMPSSDMVSVFGFVNVGSTMEGPFLGTGLSHFLEHMIFKGTARRKPGDIPNEIQSLGGVINASTGFDYTIFTITVPGTAFSQGLDILADMLMNATIDEEEFQREKQVVLSELEMYKDKPDRYLSEMVFRTVYRSHPYKVPIIGYEDVLKSLTAGQMKQHYKQFYAPNNIVLVVAGGIKSEEVIEEARRAFEHFQRMPVQLRDLPPEPRQMGMREYDEVYPTPLTRMSLAYRGTDIFHDDMVALDALAAILGQGESSRLYRELVQRQALVQSISASNFTPVDAGVFEIESSFMGVPVETVVDAISGEIAKIQKSGVSEEELLKVKKSVWKDYWERQRTSESMAYDLAVNEGLFGDSLFSFRYAQRFDQLKPADVQRAANEFLVNDGLTKVVLRPQDQDGTAQAAEPQTFDKDAIEVIRFDNGLTVLLRNNPTLPLVQVVMVFSGGTGQEDEKNNGLSNLFRDCWEQGTKRFSAEQLHQLLEEKGISLSAFSGRNSFGLQLSAMRDDLQTGLDLLTDVVLHPTFPEEELTKSRQRVHTAISARDDDLLRAGQRVFLEELFSGHPARLTELGTHDSVDQISREDMLRYYREYVHPNNAVISVFGNFDRAEVVAFLKKSFGGLKEGEVNIASTAPAPITESKIKTAYFDKEQAVVILGAQAVGFYHEDRYGLEVLAAVLGSPFRGRIFNVIREQMGASYRLGGGYQPIRDTGYLQFQVLTSPERAQEVKAALELLVADLRKQPVDAELLESTKAYLIGGFRRTKETDAGFSFMVALDELYALGWDNYQGYEEKINAVTAADVQRLAQTYLADERLVTVLALPNTETHK